jgi:type II secretory pathway pseudopilin PulG
MKMYRRKKAPAVNQRGYLLVGLLAMMTISLIVMAAAMPQLKFEAQREHEEEMLWRGQQVAKALELYSSANGSRLPTTLEELVEGNTVLGGKKIHYLRPHALCDPMSPCTPGKSNWRIVRRGDPVISSMIASLEAYRDKKKDFPVLVTQINQSIMWLRNQAPQVVLPGQGTSLTTQPGGGLAPEAPPNQNAGNPPPPENENGSSLGFNSEQGPIVGVVSHSQDRPIRTILDIENYDKELFFAGGPVIAGGFFSPFFIGSGQQAPQVNPCPNGGYLLPDNDGKLRCFGSIFDGQKPPSSRPK